MKAIPIEAVLDLATQIRARFKKEIGPEDVDDLKQKEPRLVQLMVDVDWILTNWAHNLVKANSK